MKELAMCRQNALANESRQEKPERAARSRVGIAELVSELPECYRAPLVLRYVKGLQTEQVAAALGRSLEATRGTLNRGVNALREALSASRASKTAPAPRHPFPR